MGKPSKGTSKDRRLKANKGSKSGSSGRTGSSSGSSSKGGFGGKRANLFGSKKR